MDGKHVGDISPTILILLLALLLNPDAEQFVPGAKPCHLVRSWKRGDGINLNSLNRVNLLSFTEFRFLPSFYSFEEKL